MSKKIIALVLALALCCTMSSAFALNFTGCQQNEATFETLEEARENSPAGVQNLEQNASRAFASHPVLDGIAAGTVFVYRSPNLFGGRASARMNTVIYVYVDQHFDDKDAAYAYIDSLGLIDIANEAIGSIILVTPANGRSFGQTDQNNYYKLQMAVTMLKGGGTVDGKRVTFAEGEYFGGFNFLYAIGINGGASFLSTYVASISDFASRLAGILLINGKMDSIRKVACVLPTYLVGARDVDIDKFVAANDTDVIEVTDEATTYYNEVRPLQKVVVATAEHDDAWFVHDAYYNMFIKAQRIPVLKAGMFDAGTPYQGGTFDQAPYSLCERNAVLNGVTPNGIHVITTVSDILSEYKIESGEYIQTWYEYLPEDVLYNTAPAGTVPLVLGIHGTGDDPRGYVDEIGLLALMNHEHFAVVSPEHNALGGLNVDIEKYAFAALVEYMLDKYPALDASRVYVTGYSMGAGCTMKAGFYAPQLFAAIVPMSPVASGGTYWHPTEEDLAQFADIDLPMLMTTSGYDLAYTFDNVNEQIGVSLQEIMNQAFKSNELATVDAFDFDAYPMSGFKADKVTYRVLNNEYKNTTWMLNKDGVPMVGLSITEGLIHALYPEYGKIFWNFVKHYSRDLTTGEIVYDPWVD